jgi:hypothetical protein
MLAQENSVDFVSNASTQREMIRVSVQKSLIRIPVIAAVTTARARPWTMPRRLNIDGGLSGSPWLPLLPCYCHAEFEGGQKPPCVRNKTWRMISALSQVSTRIMTRLQNYTSEIRLKQVILLQWTFDRSITD